MIGGRPFPPIPAVLTPVLSLLLNLRPHLCLLLLRLLLLLLLLLLL